MKINNIIKKIKRIHSELNGSTIQFDCSDIFGIVGQITELKNTLQELSDSELKSMISHCKNGLKSNVISMQECLIEVYAIIAIAMERIFEITPFDVQLAGAVALHNGKLIEMQTGEGKTITAVFAACLNALSGQGVHVVTFNDYLAARDRDWMKPVYDYIGLSSGTIIEGMCRDDRKVSYACDVTYGTAREIGYDYLKDCHVYKREDRILQPFNYAIIDEADSIMIDEARIPLIIAGEAVLWKSANPCNDSELKKTVAGVVDTLEYPRDYQFDQYKRNVFLTEEGMGAIESSLGCGNLYDEKNDKILSCVHYGLHARTLLHKGVDYIVRNGETVLIDEFTGRIAHKRQWPEGLQDAIEAREELPVKNRGVIVNTITIQHLFQLYQRVAGMTATAQDSEEEFRLIYNLHIVVLPPNRECIRIDYLDYIVADIHSKWNTVVKDIKTIHKSGRPILVGTQNIKETVELSEVLAQCGIKCNILNAENDACEAQIIADAGKLGAITISTNMAGRGTDIKLGGSDQNERVLVASLGGLYVIGTNRHESRRIDNQLRGRAGRQGDPGSSRFIICLEDDLFVRYNLKELLPRRFFLKKEDEQLSSHDLPIEIDRVQRIIEGQHCDIKMTLYKYSLLLEHQRLQVLSYRNEILESPFAKDLCFNETPEKYEYLMSAYTTDKVEELCRYISLKVIDENWILYLENITDLKDTIHLRKYGKQEPLLEFRSIIAQLFLAMICRIEEQIISLFRELHVGNITMHFKAMDANATSSTWTYLVNDDPFRDKPDLLASGSSGISAWVGLLWPLLIMRYFIIKKRKKGYSKK